MKKGWTKRHGVLLAIVACVMFAAALAVPAARACLSDSSLVLNDGELPGGG